MTAGTHNSTLMIMSIAIAIFASYTALDLAARVRASAGRMRQDLYETVGMPEIRVPALRERMEDFDELAEAMAGRRGVLFGASALEMLREHGWGGNLAELWQVCVEVAGTPGGVVEAGDLPRLGEGNGKDAVLLDEVIERHVRDVLQEHEHRSVAAR